MKKLITATVLLVSSFASASGGHFHPKKVAKCEGLCTEDQIKAAVPAAVKELYSWRLLDMNGNQQKLKVPQKKNLQKKARHSRHGSFRC